MVFSIQTSFASLIESFVALVNGIYISENLGSWQAKAKAKAKVSLVVKNQITKDINAFILV